MEEEGGGVIEDAAELPDGAEPVESPVAGSVWKVLILEEGRTVEEGEDISTAGSWRGFLTEAN